MNISVISSTMLHAAYLSKCLREADLKEIKALGCRNSYQALMMGYLSSRPYCYTALRDNMPVCMFGVVPEENPKFGRIWFLGSDELTNKKIDPMLLVFLRWSRDFFPTLVEPYTAVGNIVHSENDVHIKWLEWLGFKFIRNVQAGPYNEIFIEFAKIV